MRALYRASIIAAACGLGVAAAEGSGGEAGRAVLFVVNSYTGTIGEYDALTGAAINPSFISGLNGPEDVAVSGSTLYVSLTGTGRIATYNTNTGALLNAGFVIGSAGAIPAGLTVAGGDLFATIQGGGAISEYDAATGIPVAVPFAATSGYYPEKVAVANGTVFVTNEDQGTVDEFNLATQQGTWSFINEGLGVGPYGILAAGSNLLIANQRTNVVAEYTQAGAAVTARFISGLSAPFALATDGGSTLYISNYANGLPGTGSIGAYNINTGAAVNASLVTGLAGAQGLAYAYIAVDHFAITVPAQSGQQVPFFFAVTAEDANNNPVTSYTGPVQFTSSDRYAILPPNEMLTNGTGTFAAALTSLGSQTITVADVNAPTVAATSADINNLSEPTWAYLLVNAPATVIYGAPVQIMVSGIGSNDLFDSNDNDGLSFATTDPAAVFPLTGGLANGSASFNCTFYTIGTQQFYVHDTSVAGIGGSSFNIVVSAASTSVAVQTSPPSPVAGQSTTLTATVTAQLPCEATVNTGQILFNENGTFLGSAPVGSNGRAVLTTSALTAGAVNIQAVYNQGSPDFLSGTGTLPVTIQNASAAATSTVLSSTSNPAVYGQPLTLTATVSSTSAVTTGTVTFTDGTTTLGQAAVNAAGQAQWTESGLAVGVHGLTAMYAPSGGAFAPSSGTLDVTIDPAATTLTVNALPSPATTLQPVTLTATASVIAPSTATITGGSVAFSVNGGPLATVAVGAGGQASYVASALPVGNNAISATYSPPNGSGLNGSSGSGEADIIGAQTATDLSASVNPTVDGQPVTLTADVTAGAPITSGSVTFVDGTTTLGTLPVDAGGEAAWTTVSLGLGANALTATYVPSSDVFEGSTGDLTVTVDDAATAVTVSTNPASPTPGEPVTFTAVVAAAAPSELPVASGSVAFSVNGTVAGTAAVDGSGSASFTVASLPAGAYDIAAAYTPSMDSGLNAGSGATDIAVGAAEATSTSVSVSASPSVFQQPVTLTATVSASTSVTAGTVSFAANGETLGSVAVDAGGQASFTTGVLPVGTDNISAAFVPAGGNFSGSEGSATTTVNPAATALTLVVTPNPAAPGTAVTLTATVSADAPSLAAVNDGSVTFAANGAVLGTVPVGAEGNVAWTSNILPPGALSLTAAYAPAAGSGLQSSTASASLLNAAAPQINVGPASFSTPAGGSAFFWVAASGTAPLAYQWYLNGGPIVGANSPLLAITDAQAANAGSYSVAVSNAAGSVSPGSATLTVTGAGGTPPQLLVEPLSQTIAAHGTLILTALVGSGTISGASTGQGVMADLAGGASYQWFMDGSPLPGATDSTLVISNATSANAGSYTCVISTSAGAVQTAPATIAVMATSNPGHLVNASCLAAVGGASNPLIMGVESGPQGAAGTEPLLVRASGPALAAFGLPAWLPDPQIAFYGNQGILATNAAWGGDSQVAAAAQMVGAFPWTDAGSHDAALLESVLPGGYSAVVDSAGGQAGLVLAEFYDATAGGGGGPQLLDASARGMVGRGDQVLTLGFVVGGTTSATVLIRASGPALAAFGVNGTLPDPQLQLFGGSPPAVLQSNTGWGADPNVGSVAASVGAFSWGTSATADSALLVTLPPGSYAAQVSGASGDTGAALVEVYVVP